MVLNFIMIPKGCSGWDSFCQPKQITVVNAQDATEV